LFKLFIEEEAYTFRDVEKIADLGGSFAPTTWKSKDQRRSFVLGILYRDYLAPCQRVSFGLTNHSKPWKKYKAGCPTEGRKRAKNVWEVLLLRSTLLDTYQHT
jgi:hypothetical protein